MPSTLDFKEKLAALQREVEAGLQEFLLPCDTRPERLHTAMRYSMMVGGKRLRPVLALAVADLFDRKPAAFPVAVALECIHTYSLIHDDLPAMDNDDLRRGRPTCHRQFDEPTAILAGDALLTHAFSLVAEAYADKPALAVALLREMARAAGSEKLIGGQMEDILAEGGTISVADLDFIHSGKTAALLTASIVCGGLVGGADAVVLQTLRDLGLRLGMAFQIVDDILDATATSEALGKTAGKDARSRKATVVSLHGLDTARRMATGHTKAATELCASLPGDTVLLRDLIRSLEHRAN